MYNKVIIPLDGSKLAEVALPHLEVIARGCSIPEILLISVTEELRADIPKRMVIAEDASAREFHTVPTKGFTFPDSPIEGITVPLGSTHMGQTGLIFSANSKQLTEMPTRLGRMAKTAWNYLAKVANQLEEKGLNTSINILVGNPAEQIVQFAKDQKADLIVMASRGKSGFSRWDMGNIADKVIRATDVTVLLVKPQPGFKETKARRRGKPL